MPRQAVSPAAATRRPPRALPAPAGNRRGAPRHRGGRIGIDVPKEELELRFAELIERHGYPRPLRNALVDTGNAVIEVDCLWREAKLIVELDSRAFHRDIRAFERDRERDRMLTTNGWRVIRLTWRQLHADERAVVADLCAALRGVPP